MKKIPYVANFDSATSIVYANANFLRGKDFKRLGFAPIGSLTLSKLINRLPKKLREQVYIWFGWFEASSVKKLEQIATDEIYTSVTKWYPQKPYPAIAIGSSNGALMHLWCALGIPWLPQTFFIAVKQPHIHQDEPIKIMEWGKAHAALFLKNNPDIQLHHMHDPVQDRLMTQHITYFRIKCLKLGLAYKEFIKSVLKKGGTIFVVDCQQKWPCTKISYRHYFQFGALGGATTEEYFEGSDRVRQYLRNYQSPYSKWTAPASNCEMPEAEWGFEELLLDDIKSLGLDEGYKIVRLGFKEPEDASPFVADLYQWWYEQQGIKTNKLLVESFLVTEPWWTIKTASVPFWMLFNKQPSLDRALSYLDKKTFDEIYLTLFSHGVDSIGLPAIQTWRKVIDKALRHGKFLGVNEKKFPRDFAVYLNFYYQLKSKVSASKKLPKPLKLEQLASFIENNPSAYPIQWQRIL